MGFTWSPLPGLVCVIGIIFGINSYSPAAGKTVPVLISPITVGDNRVFGYDATQPAYDIALERARALYPRVFDDYVYLPFYVPGVFPSCPESAAQMLILFTELYNSTRPKYDAKWKIFIISPGCSDEMAQLADLCREMDLVVIASTAADPNLANNARYPTLLSLGPSEQFSIAQTVLDLVKLHSWERISVIGDVMNGDVMLSPLLLLYDRTIRQYLLDPTSGVNALVQNIDSTKGFANFDAELKTAAAHSSIFLLFGFAVEVYVTILTRAIDFHMNTGNCVFLIVQLNELPFYHGSLESRENVLKEKAPSILPFVFELTSPPYSMTPDGTADWDKIVNQSRLLYNRTIEPDYQYNHIEMSAYDSALILAEVINETYDQLENMSAAAFITHFRNRSFDAHTFANLKILNTRRRSETTIVKLYHASEGEFQATWSRMSGEDLKLVHLPPNWKIQWQGHYFPPPAGPACRIGLLAGDVDCSSPDLSSYNYFAFVIVPIFAGGVYFTVLFRKKVIEKDNKWWNVDFEAVDFDGLTNSGYPTYRLAIAGMAVNEITLDGRETSVQNALYKGEVVQVLKFSWDTSFTDVIKNKAILSILHQLRNLDHPNIARFYGLSFDHGHKTNVRQLLIITESPKKGLLRDLIDSDKLALNWSLRSSLIWDILRGLRYIHASPFKYHGFIGFMSLIIDQHFTLKINHTGSVHYYNAMKTDPTQRFPVPRIANLWMAPEAVDQETKDGSVPAHPTSASDVFSFGVVLYEMATRNTPFEVDITDIKAIKAKIWEIRSGQLDVNAYPLPEDTPVEIVEQIKKCWSFIPAQRPTITQLSRTLLRLHPGSDISVAEGILRRLEQYNQELEATIAARKEGLNLEKAKVDALLSNVLPKSIVQKLRNGEPPVPDYFTSVTVLFSDIPAFNDMVAKCSPFSIVDFLHRLYSKMDEVIDKHDVYKVETIKDSYMVASGLPMRNDDRHATEIAKVALMFLQASSGITAPTEYQAKCPYIRLRIGVNSGPCVAAVIGQKQPRYCLVGDTVNTASRMETNGEAQKIHITSSTKALLDGTKLFSIEERGVISIKGKNEMLTYWLTNMKTYSPESAPGF